MTSDKKHILMRQIDVVLATLTVLQIDLDETLQDDTLTIETRGRLRLNLSEVVESRRRYTIMKQELAQCLK